jgi:hypothetical protein
MGRRAQTEHDLLDLVTSGYLERLGFDYKPEADGCVAAMMHCV